MTTPRHPLAPVVDLLVFAPIGLAVVARDRLPELVETSLQRAETQVRVARMVGEFAVQIGRRELSERLRSLVPAAGRGTTGHASSVPDRSGEPEPQPEVAAEI